MNYWFILRIILHAALLVLIITAILSLFQLIRFLKRSSDPVLHPVIPGSKEGSHPAMVGLQLQAYERLVLFAERISPGQLVRRLILPDSTARDLQYAIIQAIRAEFDHNISQQIYVSSEAWESLRQAQEQEITLVNELADQLPEEAPSAELGKKLIELENDSSFPLRIALNILNVEARKLMAKSLS